MQAFYMLVAAYLLSVCILQQTVPAYGLHTHASPQTNTNVLNSPRRPVSGSRITPVSQRRAAFRAVQRARQPQLWSDRIYPHGQRPSSGAFTSRYMRRNYPHIRNRNVIQPTWPAPSGPPVHFYQRPPSFRHAGFRLPTNALIPPIRNKNIPYVLGIRPAVTIETKGGILGPPVAQKNSLLMLLEERQPIVRDERGVLLIRHHLIELNTIRSLERLDQDLRLDKQVKYIENITDSDIQREVLKIFVKDMVEKSGFLNSQNASNVQDIDSLKALVVKIGSITDKFTRFAHSGESVPLHITSDMSASTSTDTHIATTTELPRFDAETDLTNRITEADLRNRTTETDLRNRIANALTTYDRDAHVSSAQTDTTVQAFQGREKIDKRLHNNSRSQPSVGMSIFGEVILEATTLPTNTADIKTDSAMGEPLGGNDAYWTHLRAGLADMLCSLCRQRRRQSCIVRFCQNDIVKIETETPSTPTEIRMV